MRAIALIAASVLLAFLLNPADSVSDEKVAHFGQMVDNNGGPNDCIVCHDGTIASDVHICIVECDIRTSHSIFREYPPRNKESVYATVESLQEKGIRLFEGKVSCVSCHDLRKSTKYFLVTEDRGSILCYSCHRI